MWLRNLRKKIIPDYAVIPFLLCGIGQVSAFYLVRFVNRLIYGPFEGYYDMTTKFDDMLPITPWWVLIYIFAYVFWLVSYIWVANESKEMCCRFLTADMLGKIACAVIFVLIPTTNIRPELPADDFARPVLEIIYFLDTPDNLFPSMHCSVSWFAVRYVTKCQKIPVWYKIASWVITFAIFFSVLFTKQHVIADVIGGALVAEICVWIGEKTNLHKYYSRTEDVVVRFYERIEQRKNRKAER